MFFIIIVYYLCSRNSCNYIILSHYLTNRFYFEVRYPASRVFFGLPRKIGKRVVLSLFSNRSQMTSKCGKNKEVAHEPAAGKCVFDVFTTLWRLLWSIFWTELDPRQHSIYLLHNDLKLRNYMISRAQNSKSLVAMTHRMATVVEVSYRLGILKVTRTFFVSVSPVSFFVNFSCLTFFRAFTCLIRNNLTNAFKTARHVEQNNENKFPVTSSMYLYSNTSWATTNHSARSIQITV